MGASFPRETLTKRKPECRAMPNPRAAISNPAALLQPRNFSWLN
jgi:hypothetical protein